MISALKDIAQDAIAGASIIVAKQVPFTACRRDPEEGHLLVCFVSVELESAICAILRDLEIRAQLLECGAPEVRGIHRRPKRRSFDYVCRTKRDKLSSG